MKILIDTDVILDLFFDRKPYCESAAKILSLCESNKIEGYVTPVIVRNVYYLLRKRASHNNVITQLRLFLSIVNISPMNKESILKAINSPFRDFEDALKNYSAESDETIKIIVTRNVKDYQDSALSIQTPESFLRLINAI